MCEAVPFTATKALTPPSSAPLPAPCIAKPSRTHHQDGARATTTNPIPAANTAPAITERAPHRRSSSPVAAAQAT